MSEAVETDVGLAERHGAGGVGEAVTPGEHAYERIRADIVFGRLQPGQRLTLDRLRLDYGVAISTLREILQPALAGGARGGRRAARLPGGSVFHGGLP